jgi:hypothetical protein
MRSSRRTPAVPVSLLLAPLAAAALAAMSGCAAEATTRPEPLAAVDQAEISRIDKSRKTIDEASRALSEKRYSEARTLLQDAVALGVESHRFEIGELIEKVDKREAKLWANEVSERFDQKECEEAFKDLAAQVKERQSETFTKELHKLVHAQATACANATIDEATTAGKFAEARAFLAAEPTRLVLGEAAWERQGSALDATIGEAVYGSLAPDVTAGNWASAVEKLDAAAKKGDAAEAQVQTILERIRAAATPQLTAAAAKAIGGRDAPAALKLLDATVALLRWQELAPDLAAVASDKALPEALFRKHAALATWVEALRLQMKPGKKAEKRWTHGAVAVAPAAKAQGESRRDLKPSAEVWVLGQTKQLALVADADPGAVPLAAALELAIGWVPLARLAAESTVDWVAPNDQLKGERVWGPLRERQPTLELGVVSEVQGADILVKRLADDAVVKLSRKQLRSGRLAPGTKVLAFCKAENDMATIFEVPLAGKVARLQCEGGLQKEESLASLRTKPDLLPPSR